VHKTAKECMTYLCMFHTVTVFSLCCYSGGLKQLPLQKILSMNERLATVFQVLQLGPRCCGLSIHRLRALTTPCAEAECMLRFLMTALALLQKCSACLCWSYLSLSQYESAYIAHSDNDSMLSAVPSMATKADNKHTIAESRQQLAVIA
jgi:hypothetical protein